MAPDYCVVGFGVCRVCSVVYLLSVSRDVCGVLHVRCGVFGVLYVVCGVLHVWCGVMWCGVPKALSAKGNGRDGLAHGKMQAGRAVCLGALSVVCCDPVAEGRLPLWCRVVTVPGCPGDALPLRLIVLPKFSLSPVLGASGPWWGIDEART